MLFSKIPLYYFLKYKPIIINAKAMKKVKNHFIISFLDVAISVRRFAISSLVAKTFIYC